VLCCTTKRPAAEEFKKKKKLQMSDDDVNHAHKKKKEKRTNSNNAPFQAKDECSHSESSGCKAVDDTFHPAQTHLCTLHNHSLAAV
jgi:hypothetical protein